MTSALVREQALEIAERIDTVGPVTVKRLFGGAGLFAQGIMFAMMIRGSLYLRVDAASRAKLEALGAKPFSYATRSKTVTVASFYEAPGEVVEDSDELGRWAIAALSAAKAAAEHKATKSRKAGAKRKPRQ